MQKKNTGKTEVHVLEFELKLKNDSKAILRGRSSVHTRMKMSGRTTSATTTHFMGLTRLKISDHDPCKARLAAKAWRANTRKAGRGQFDCA
jgi:hypothetical protein